MRCILLTLCSITYFVGPVLSQVESPSTQKLNSQEQLNSSASNKESAQRAEKLVQAVAKARESLETGRVTIGIETEGEKNQQLATFDLTRVQFVGQIESGKQSGEAAMWDGDAVTVVSRFGTQGVRIVATGTSAAFLFDPRCIGIQGPLSQSSTVEDELSLGRAKSFEIVNQNEIRLIRLSTAGNDSVDRFWNRWEKVV